MADVSATFSALSSTESSNSPAGTTVIGANLDDNLRLMQAHTAAWRDQTGWAGLTLTSVAGTNTITATLATAGSVTFGPTALAANQRYILTPANTNTGATTLNITSPNGGSALGAKNIFSGGVALVGGELIVGVPYELQYDGTQFNILGRSSLQASFTGTLTGCTTSPTVTIVYSVFNNVATLYIPPITATSNTTACTITGLPAAVTPATTHQFLFALTEDNGTSGTSAVDVTNAGVITLRTGAGALITPTFTNTGTKGIPLGATLTYNLN